MSTGRVYSVSFEGIAAATVIDLFEIAPAANKPVRILGMTLSQGGTTDVGDAGEEILRFQILRGYTTSGSGGTSTTPVPLRSTTATVGFVAETCNTTGASTTTPAIVMSDSFNVRSGYQIFFPPECQPEASAANTTIVVRLVALPGDAISLSGTLFIEELG